MTALIEPSALYALLQNKSKNLKVIDATYPSAPGSYKPRIEGAIPFDIDLVSDHENPLPHMLPDAESFAAAVGAMGIQDDDELVIYDDSGIAFAAARVWWTFRVFGHDRVRVLNGGLPLWMASGYPVKNQPDPLPDPVLYQARFRPELVRTAEQISNSIGNKEILILDARSSLRFTGAGTEPRPGMSPGHIPGSTNLPYDHLLQPGTGALIKDSYELIDIIQQKPSQVIASCGSGVTACVLALALYETAGIEAAVYDGSWSEWGNSASGRPVETGPGHKFRIENS